MLKSLAKNSIIYYFSTILTKGVSFFLLPLYTAILSAEDYGVLNMMSIGSTIVIIIFTLQIGQAVARYYNELRNQKHTQIFSSTIAFFAIFSFSLFTCVALFFLPTIAFYLELPEITARVAILSVALNGLFYLSQNQLTWKIKPFQEMLGSLAYNVSTISLTVYFLVYANEGIHGVFKAQCLGALIGISVGYFFTRKDYAAFFSVRVLKKLFRYALPLLPGALSIFVFSFTDQICIKAMLGLDPLGVYSVGNKIATILTFTGIGVSTALSPLIYKHYKETETPEKIALLFRLFSSFSFVVMAFLAINAGILVKMMTTEAYSGAITIIPFLLFAVYMNSLTFFFPGLSIAKKTAKISLIAATAAALNLGLNLLLIPDYGIFAAAAITCFSFGVNFFLLYYFSQKEYPVKVSLLPHFILSLLFFGMMYVMNYFNVEGSLRLIGFVICAALTMVFILKKNDLVYIREKLARVVN